MKPVTYMTLTEQKNGFGFYVSDGINKTSLYSTRKSAELAFKKDL